MPPAPPRSTPDGTCGGADGSGDSPAVGCSPAAAGAGPASATASSHLLPNASPFAHRAGEYVFDAAVLHRHAATLGRDAPWSALAALAGGGSRTVLDQFSLGPALSGAQPHFHGDAASVLVFGLKLWLLFPPACAFYSAQPAAEYVAEALASETPLCEGESAAAVPVRWVLQRAGDVVVVPALWGHVTLNLADTVGVAFEFVPAPGGG